MASRIEFPTLPPSVAVLPFLFMARARGDRDWDFNAALAAAVAAEQACGGRRSTRQRIAWLLCELCVQYGRRTGDPGEPVPLSRAELARALGIGLVRVKRILALLCLSQVIESDRETIRILDWRRLAAAAGYCPAHLGSALAGEEESEAAQPEEPDGPPLLTAAGDPAYFG